MVNLNSISRLIRSELNYIRFHRPIYKTVPPVTNALFKESNLKGYDLIAGPSTLLPYCTGKNTIKEVIEALRKLENDTYTDYLINYYEEGLKKYGANWHYADITTVLIGLSSIIKPENYLEIGVRTGRSLAMVISKTPNCNAVGFDMWIQNYANMENPGPDFVTNVMKKVNHSGKLELISGNSHKTVPEYLKLHPDIYFDMITVDGDHSMHGASIDFAHVLPRLKIGGAIIFDDIAHPSHQSLIKVWNKYVVSDPRFASFSFTELGFGIGFAIRKY